MNAAPSWAESPSAKAALLFACLFAAALAAAAIVLASRTSDLVLEVVGDFPHRFSPDGDGRDEIARLTFFVRESDPNASVFIVGKDRAPIRTLDSDVALEADERVTYVWHGLTDSDERAPVGRYRLRVVLPDHDRDMIFPTRIDLTRDGREPAH